MSQTLPIATAILLAGGSGSRMGGAVKDKILHEIGGKPVFQYSLEAFNKSQRVHHLVVVYRDQEQRLALEQLANDPSIQWARGGAERQFSVWAGLQTAPKDTEIVLIHDCARPLIQAETINATINAAQAEGAACVARKTTDTIKTVSKQPHRDSYKLSTVDRSKLWSMETPQVFQYELILQSYRRIIESNQTITDDLSAIEACGHPVHFVSNPCANPKLTTPEDAAYIEFLINHQIK